MKRILYFLFCAALIICVSAVNLNQLAQMGATTGQVMKWDGSKWAPANETSGTTNMDAAYNNFGANPSKITIDAAESQTGGLVFESANATNLVVNLASTGDFNIQDNGSQTAQFGDNGNVGMGINAQSGNRLSVQQTGSGTQAAFSVRNGIDEDAQGVAIDWYNAGSAWGRITSSNPSGSLKSQFIFSGKDNAGSLNPFIIFQEDQSQLQLKNAIYMDVTNGTAATHTCDGLTSVLEVPTSSSTTTINLPEIVTGVPAANQVNVGYQIDISIDRSVNVTISRSGAADVLQVGGSTSTVTSITTTGGTYYCKRLRAVSSDKWVVY